MLLFGDCCIQRCLFWSRRSLSHSFLKVGIIFLSPLTFSTGLGFWRPEFYQWPWLVCPDFPVCKKGESDTLSFISPILSRRWWCWWRAAETRPRVWEAGGLECISLSVLFSLCLICAWKVTQWLNSLFLDIIKKALDSWLQKCLFVTFLYICAVLVAILERACSSSLLQLFCLTEKKLKCLWLYALILKITK